MNRFHKFIACAGLAVVVFGIVLAVNPHCAHGAEQLWSCHAGPPPRHYEGPDPWVAIVAFGAILAAALMP